MQATIRSSDRMVLQLGTGLAALPGTVVEDLTDAVLTQVLAAQQSMRGDGGVVLSTDHGAVSLQPPSAAWTAAEAATAALLTLRTQHSAALAALRPALTANATTISNDLAALQTIAAALQAGTQPTAGQMLQVLRLMLRVLAVQNG